LHHFDAVRRSSRYLKIEATILIVPIGKARARHAVKGGRVMTYTPAKTRLAEAVIQTQIRQEVLKHGVFGGAQAIKLIATFYRPRPKHLPKRVTMPVTRPDWDNYGKLVSDALEKFVYDNDSQITTAIIKKRFGSPPRIELLLEEDAE